MTNRCFIQALVAASPAFSRAITQQKVEARFAAADVEHDGELTKSEAPATGVPLVARHFDEVDTGHPGYVTLDQIEQYASQHQR